MNIGILSLDVSGSMVRMISYFQESTRYEPVAGGAVPEHESTYTQSFSFDILGNMTTKTSAETVYPEKTIGDALNYSIDFSYAEGFAHRLDHAGDRYYSYDDDGNVVRERNEAMTDSSGTDTGSDDDEWDDWDDWDDDWGDGLGEAGFGFGMGGSGSSSGNDGTESGNLQAAVYERIYEWDERDRLTGSTEGNTVVGYVYGEDENRTNKYSSIGETLYFSSMWTWHDVKSLGSGGQTTKNIYLGTERIVSKLNRGDGLDTYSEEYHKTYYWHSDHLGSAHFITDYQGNEYQRIEYTPYGEEWIELKSDSGDQYLPYKFTGKERDEETGLYYYGAIYLDPVYSRWLSTDPAVGEYLPTVVADNSNLPGMGGVFNIINGNLYHYGENNPVKYVDPDGRAVELDDVIDDRKKLLEWINEYSATQYKLNDKELEIDYSKINSKGSSLYSENIDEMINASTTFKIRINDEFIDPVTGIHDSVTAGKTYSNGENKVIYIIITGEKSKIIPYEKGFAKTSNPERILMHEIAGHAVPRYLFKDGNAVDIENQIIEELNLHRFIFTIKPRKPDSNHGTLKTY